MLPLVRRESALPDRPIFWDLQTLVTPLVVGKRRLQYRNGRGCTNYGEKPNCEQLREIISPLHFEVTGEWRDGIITQRFHVSDLAVGRRHERDTEDTVYL